MATIATNRASHQHINPLMRVGKSRKPILTSSEQAEIRKAVAALQRAIDATDRMSLDVNLTTAWNITRRKLTILRNGN